MAPLCADLAARGWAAWNLEYRRLGASGGGWPRHARRRARAAIDHLADLDAPLDLGARRGDRPLAPAATSPLWAAARRAPRVPLTGAVAQAGVVDLATRIASCGSPTASSRRSSAARPRSCPTATRPPRPPRLPLGVPELLVHGEADDIVPPRSARASPQRARGAGDDVELALLDGEATSSHIDPANPLWQAP